MSPLCIHQKSSLPNRCVLAAIFALAIVAFIPRSSAQDSRSFQHGIDFVPLPSGHYKLIWSSSGHPPQGADNDGNWPHDVYYSDINPAAPVIVPQNIISRPEAQEPASSAITTDGHIMVTMEDGWNADNVLAQRFGVYDSEFSPVKGYPQTVFDGGHSGHVAAVGNQFVVFYSEDWIDGGGVDDLGSGDDVYVSTYLSSGKPVHASDVAVGNKTRDWWPLVSGSSKRALLLWQRFVDHETHATLMYSIYNPANGSFTKTETPITETVKYYTYDTQYLPSIKRFLIVGTFHSGGGFAFLLDDRGQISARNLALPEFVREAQPAVRRVDDATDIADRAVYPQANGGVMVLEATADSITLKQRISGADWETAGTDGIFTTDNQAYFVNLSPNGLIERKFQIDDQRRR